ncbi:uroporphyrinogen-III decarboxylase [Oceanobacillus polygoni]|uniref:Uroporphyrinogen-III decarboxylase n=2 Tax=Oceanobacillus polygoni TaxID=1235259 RepID=A0A9X0YMR5_9BACI|nr:uroporphyrinogen-III decarboxylase [Oceanobacillus polygoni]
MDMKENPALFKQALDVITETTVNFVEANVNADVDGFFFATQCATTELLTEEECKEFGVSYDLKVIESYNQATFLNIAHMHGDRIMFDLIEKYPVNVLNWHDRWVSPSLAEARSKTDKCLLGGIRELVAP